MRITICQIATLAGLAALTACVPNQAYRLKESTYKIHFPDDGRYFLNASAGLAFIEFNKKGQLFEPAQVSKALDMIAFFNQLDQTLNGARARGAVVLVFIHGWKNNASEDSGNVWGFRRALDEFACIASPRPVLGIYIGWPGVGFPGANSGFLENLSFSDRESVAYGVGGNPLRETLVKIMEKTKGPDFSGKSSCILMGHSFGGLVLEHAITPVLKKRLDQIGPGGKISSPADLIVLINEAASARLAQPFLYYLHTHKVGYKDAAGNDYPLLLSMTSTGDVATKFAFPGGQFLSPSKPDDLKKFTKPDPFGIDSQKTYYLLTTANTVALQNREFVQRPAQSLGTAPPDTYASISVSPKTIFDMVPKGTKNDPPPKNDTPYWVSQLPQVFVPDHGAVFGYEFMRLMSQLLCSSQLVCDAGREGVPLKPACAAQPVKPPPVVNKAFAIAPSSAVGSQPDVKMLSKN